MECSGLQGLSRFFRDEKWYWQEMKDCHQSNNITSERSHYPQKDNLSSIRDQQGDASIPPGDLHSRKISQPPLRNFSQRGVLWLVSDAPQGVVKRSVRNKQGTDDRRIETYHTIYLLAYASSNSTPGRVCEQPTREQPTRGNYEVAQT